MMLDARDMLEVQAKRFAVDARVAFERATTKQGLAKVLRQAARPLVMTMRPRLEEAVVELDETIMPALASQGIDPGGPAGQFARARLREIAMLTWQVGFFSAAAVSSTVYAAFDGATYLTRGSALTGVGTTTTTATLFFGIKTAGGVAYTIVKQSTSNAGLRILLTSGNTLSVTGFTSSGTKRFEVTGIPITTGSPMNWVYLTWDQSNSSLRYVSVNGVDKTATVTWGTYSVSAWNVNTADFAIGGDPIGGGLFTGELANFFYDTAYLTSSQESSFYTAGAPTAPATAWPGAGLVKLYNPIASWQTNNGTGGGFTENGTLTAGSG